jgi:peptide/nickel transport system permease protein
MATQEIAATRDIEGWVPQADRGLAVRMVSGLWRFTRRKPLGAICGLLVLVFMIVGDVVPATANKVASEAGLGEPVPYFADQLRDALPFVYPYERQNLRARLKGSSADHLLGTDSNGRDVFSRILYGTRTAVMVSFGAVFISMTVGAAIGIMSGYYGGWVDKVLYRIVDIFQALPGLVLLITILGLFGSGLWQMIFALGIVFGPTNSRVIRGQTLSVCAMPFMEAARVLGASDRRIMLRYILPNVFPIILLQASVWLGVVVLVEASLSFLGFGIQPPFPSWGQMLSLEGRQFMSIHPGLAIYPGVAIGVLVFSFNLFGDALRDVLDPRLRGSR